MASVALFQRDHGHAETAGAGGMRVDALDSRYAEFIEIVPYPRRADDREEAALFIGWVVSHQCVGKNRIVAIMHRGDFHQRTTGFGPAVIAGEFAERSFAPHRIRLDDAF